MKMDPLWTTVEEVLQEYKGLIREDVLACLQLRR